MPGRPFPLSASTLSVFLDCPRCFWLQVREGQRRPQGPFPSLPSGMDAVVKRYMDDARARDELPTELAGKVTGTLFRNQRQLDDWRDALRGTLRVTDQVLGVTVRGGLDDLLEEPDRALTPLDYKTRGSAVRVDTHRHYEHQLDLYAWLLDRLGQRTSGQGVLLVFSPQTYVGRGRVEFRTDVVALPTDVERAEKLLTRAVGILRGPLPPRHGECAFCHYFAAAGS